MRSMLKNVSPSIGHFYRPMSSFSAQAHSACAALGSMPASMRLIMEGLSGSLDRYWKSAKTS
jgi:hypothetical protein